MREKTAQKILAKTKQDYNFLSHDFSHTRVRSWPEIESFAGELKDNSKILDVGCGNGRLFKILSEKKKIQYNGLDLSKNLIEIAKDKYKDHPDKPHFQAGNVMNLPFKDVEFDTVFAIAVLHHLPSYDYRLKAVKEMRRVLKKDGLLLMTNWNLWQAKYIVRVLKTSLKSIFDENLDFGDVFIPWITKEVVVKRYYHAFTLSELERLCQEAGFNIVKNELSGERKSYLESFNMVTILKK
ncbi:class I SAM-dependent methyltransferase [Patescibacteria group bacterium]|nr:class I SAM-dependent methyltransferase [Patescibacteria group bacterium]